MRQHFFTVMVLSVCLASLSFAHPPIKVPADRPVPRIQIALLLDTSNSMDGLITQAKTQLWNIVNELGRARCGTLKPQLEVALFEYGNDRLSAGEGYLRMVIGFTTDLDKLSEKLFELRTNGGSEYCGQVMQSALEGLAWSDREADLKSIYIAGNEPFTQGPVDYRVPCKTAMSKNIFVNPIFCGPRKTGIATHWQDGAVLTGGRYLHIDKDRQVVYREAPQDTEIARLNVQLNATFIAFGDQGLAGAMRQKMQDTAAASVDKEILVKRAVAKSSHNYSNEAWDLVDAVRKGKVKLDGMDEKDMPAELKGLNAKQREERIAKKLAERKVISSQIRKLSEERTQWIAQQDQKSNHAQASDTLEAVIVQSVQEQARIRHFTFE